MAKNFSTSHSKRLGGILLISWTAATNHVLGTRPVEHLGVLVKNNIPLTALYVMSQTPLLILALSHLLGTGI